MLSASLSETQRWFYSGVTADGPMADSTQIDRRLTRSSQLNGAERMAVYRTAYHLRLLECLREEYPVLRATVGDEAFDQFCQDYLRESPPKSYTLGRLSESFVAHLRRTRPPRTSARSDWFDFVLNLATFEDTLQRVFDGPGSESQQVPMQQISLTHESRLAVRLCPSLHLLALAHPVHKHWQTVTRFETPEVCPAADSYYAISRRHFVVRFLPVSEREFDLLTLLQLDGRLEAAVRSHLATHPEVTPSEIEDGLRRWSAEGFARLVWR